MTKTGLEVLRHGLSRCRETLDVAAQAAAEARPGDDQSAALAEALGAFENAAGTLFAGMSIWRRFPDMAQARPAAEILARDLRTELDKALHAFRDPDLARRELGQSWLLLGELSVAIDRIGSALRCLDQYDRPAEPHADRGVLHHHQRPGIA